MDGVAAHEVDPRIEEAWALRRSDPVSAVEHAEVLRDEALERGDDATRCRALTVAGAGHIALNDYPSALRALMEAAASIDAVGDRDRARALAELGYLETILGDMAVGLERLMEALEIHERLGDDVGRAATLNRIGVAFFSHGDLDEAQHAYERSLELIGDDAVAGAGTCNNLAKVLTERGEYEAALEHLRAAREGFEAAGETRGLGMTFHNAAVVNERLGDHERMEDQLGTAIDLYDQARHVHGACESRTHLARHLIAQGTQPQRALALLDRAHDDAERVGLPHECAKAAEGLVDVHEQLDQADQALSWLRHVRDVERNLFDRTSEQRLRSLQVRYQLERLERDSITDALTELLNRRGLDRVLRDLVAHARASGTDLAVLLLDLDDFKSINDRFSHTVGDEVLRELGELLRERTRSTDLCARFGGEEFVVALPACDLDWARKVADSLRHRIADHDWSRIASDLEVTASIGVAVLSSVADMASLLDAADRALYDAKDAGKDRVASAAGRFARATGTTPEETTARVGR